MWSKPYFTPFFCQTRHRIKRGSQNASCFYDGADRSNPQAADLPKAHPWVRLQLCFDMYKLHSAQPVAQPVALQFMRSGLMLLMKKLTPWLSIHCEVEDLEFARFIEQPCLASAAFCQSQLSMPSPTEIQVHVMTSLQSFLRNSTWLHPMRVIFMYILVIALLAVSLLIIPRVIWERLHSAFLLVLYVLALIRLLLSFWATHRSWSASPGYTSRYSYRLVIGIKPPRLLELGNNEISQRIFISSQPIEQRVYGTCCHEMAHAFTMHKRQPTWFREGVAMVTSDQFVGKTTIRSDTLEVLASSLDKKLRFHPIAQRPEDSVLLFARGYWRTRYLLEAQPGLYQFLLHSSLKPRQFEMHIANAFQMDAKTFWKENRIDRLLLQYYQGQHPCPQVDL